jgi:hypothetical protein
MHRPIALAVWQLGRYSVALAAQPSVPTNNVSQSLTNLRHKLSGRCGPWQIRVTCCHRRRRQLNAAAAVASGTEMQNKDGLTTFGYVWRTQQQILI